MKNVVLIKTKISKFIINVNINLKEGINCFFGPSGAGKTSIINCIAGINKAKESKIIINNKTLEDTNKNIFVPIHKRNIGYVFQDSRLFPHLSINNNLLYGLKLNHKKKKNFHYDEVINLLSLRHLLHRFPYNLSGGEKQRVAIGRALLCQPDLLLMDEPLASLDQDKKDELIKYIVKINEILSIPAIYVSHSISETFILANCVHFFKNGNLIYSGNREEAINFYNKNENFIYRDSYIKGKVIKANLLDGLTEIKLGKDSLTVFSNTLHLDQNVIVKIKATDIIISTIIPDKLSSLNYLKTNIEEVVFQEGLACLILNYENNTIKALLTKKSFRKLNIKKGMQCYAIIKALNINDVTNVNIV